MKLIRLLAPALFGAALAAGAAADEPRHAFECDTLAGHFSYWHRTVSFAEIEVSGKVTVNELRKDKEWSPTALAAFRDGKPRPGQYGLHVHTLAKTPEFLFIDLLRVGGSDKIGLGIIPNDKQPIPFTLRLEAGGLLKVTVAGFDASAQLGDFKPEMLELSCSTGDFEFTDVIVSEKEPKPN